MKLRKDFLDDLKPSFEQLYSNDKYYVSIPKDESYDDNKSEYWGIITDPDGIIRNRKEERHQHIEDVEYILDYINNIDPGKILDIGCGPGWILSAVSNKWEKYGIETDEQAIKISTDDSIRFSSLNLIDENYGDSFFDIILMHHVIEHIKNPVTFIDEVKRILRPGGILIIGTPDFDSACARRYGKNFRLLNDPTHISLFSNDSMHRFLRDKNFRILKVEYPYFETRFFTKENLDRLFDIGKMSPPFYGSFMTFFCMKK